MTEKIEHIREELINDPRNEFYTTHGIGPNFQLNPASKILLIGQAPGRIAQDTGICFNDKSGIKLAEWMGIDMDTLHGEKISIISMDFYFPGKAKQGDLPPRDFIADDYHKKILDLLPNIELTILIGSYAQKYYLGKDAKKNLTENVRAYKEFLPKYFPIVHPSPLTLGWVKKNPWFLEEVVVDLQEIVSEILKF